MTDNEFKDLAKKYLDSVNKDEVKRLRERERNKRRKEYLRDWEKKNKEKRGQRFFSKREAEILLKYIPINKETEDLINKLKKVLYGRIQKS